MSASKSSVSFLSLSAELRNRIYDLTIEPETLCVVCSSGKSKHRKCTKDRAAHRASLISPPLAQTCRQVRSELMPMFYHAKTFTAVLEGGTAPKTKRSRMLEVSAWLRAIGPTCAGMVKFLNIEMRSYLWDLESCESGHALPKGYCHWCRLGQLQALRISDTRIAEDRIQLGRRSMYVAMPLLPGHSYPAYMHEKPNKALLKDVEISRAPWRESL